VLISREVFQVVAVVAVASDRFLLRWNPRQIVALSTLRSDSGNSAFTRRSSASAGSCRLIPLSKLWADSSYKRGIVEVTCFIVSSHSFNAALSCESRESCCSNGSSVVLLPNVHCFEQLRNGAVRRGKALPTTEVLLQKAEKIKR
jgi:hypothetical protein